MAEKSSNNKLSGSQLKFGYWYVTHKLKIRKVIIVVLIALNTGLFGWSIIYASLIFFVYGQSHTDLMNNLATSYVDYSAFREKNKPKDLILPTIDILPSTENRTDLVAHVKNPNQKWSVPYFKYQFVSGPDVLDEGESFLFPNEEKLIIAYGVDQVYNRSDVDLNITEIDWWRFLNFEDFKNSRLNFVIKDVDFITSSKSGLTSRLPVSQTRFTITNDSAYSYWEVGFKIVLYSGQSIIGVNYATVEAFRSGQTKKVSVNWFENLSPITKTEIIPEVNIIDDSVYITY